MVDIDTHFTAQRINFAYQVSFGTAPDIRVTGHHSYAFNADGKKNGFQSEPCACQGCFTTCVACTDDTNIVIFLYNWHIFLLIYSGDALFSHTKFTENLIYQIFSYRFTNDRAKSLISVHHIDGKEIFRHSICNAL